jgi:hypothetical protein
MSLPLPHLQRGQHPWRSLTPSTYHSPPFPLWGIVEQRWALRGRQRPRG